MFQDTARLSSDLTAIVSTLCPDVDLLKLEIRLEEVLVNYQIERKSEIEAERDMADKVDLFISAIELEGYSPKTLKDYATELRLFRTFTDKAVVNITTIDIRSYLSSNKKIKTSTTGKKLFVIRSFFGWMVQEGLLLRNPALKIKAPKLPKRIPKGLSIEELEFVRESCITDRQRALIEVFYSTGCRLSEVTEMDIEDVNYQTMSMRVIGKGDKEREVFLSYKALFHLKKYLNGRADDCESLFVTQRKPYRRMTPAAVQKEVRDIEQLAKISTKLTPHVMRHTLATNMLNNGADLADVQQILGHEDPKTTLTYSHISEEKKRQTHSKYHVM